MNDMQEIITMEQANRLFLFLAIGSPLVGLALGSLAGARAKAAKQGAVKGFGTGLLGVLILGLWKVYNAITDRLGLDTVKNLVVNLALFIGFGVVAGLIAGRFISIHRMPEKYDGPDEAGGPGGSLVGAPVGGGPISGSPGEGRSPGDSLQPERDL